MAYHGSSIINETLISIFQDSGKEGPWKSSTCLRRSQAPPSDPLCKEWPLDSGGQWGYVFRYEIGELQLYQLTCGEMVQRRLASLSSNDWGVLKKVFLENFDEDEGKWRASGRFSLPETFPGASEVSERKVKFMAMWLSRASSTACWFYRASYCVEREGVCGKPREYFVLDLFSSDCSIFHTVLDVPLVTWREKLTETESKITSLFCSCPPAVRRLWNPLFIRAVEKYMNSYGFCDPYGSEDISTVTETLLLGYKSGESIYDRIYQMYDDITPDEERMERFEKLIIDHQS
ncbi:hypothetical protein KOW79_002038 [Hemibagrus wyckioides]|uniref:Uncharacterized protein n=1 Tax=Hemibagrus wyckioides TaxID=337641 RepID=A0A9D3P3Y9_9TELE|nr:hypothetical protein KOW79_002038 [Hemibagrus wyckioides]